MKKIFMGLFIGLIALFGITSTFVGTQYFLENSQVQNAVVKNENSNYRYTIYLDNSTEDVSEEILVDYIFPRDIDGFKLIDLNKNYIDISESLLEQEYQELYFSAEPPEYYFSVLGNFVIYRELFVTNWLGYIGEETIEILGFEVSFVEPLTTEMIEGINNTLNPYIGNLTSFPVEEPDEPIPPVPEPNPDSMESSIGNVIRGIIEWFVDIFNGLADAFVVTDSSGAFVGFTIWGQVLFIEVGIGLVILVLKWVISLVRGV